MFRRIVAAAVALGAISGASLAFAQNLLAERQVEAETSGWSTSKDPIACQAIALRIYFDPESSRLDRQSLDLIDMASRRVSGCSGVHFLLAADATQISRTGNRRRASERSVSILSAFRANGVLGEVYVAPVDNTQNLFGAHEGPDFVEVGIAPARPPVMITSNAPETEI